MFQINGFFFLSPVGSLQQHIKDFLSNQTESKAPGINKKELGQRKRERERERDG